MVICFGQSILQIPPAALGTAISAKTLGKEGVAPYLDDLPDIPFKTLREGCLFSKLWPHSKI